MPDIANLLAAAQALLDKFTFSSLEQVSFGHELKTLRAAVDAARSSHVYVSTACQHAKHERCRQRCKFCAVDCGCPCHVKLFPIGDAAKAAGGDGARDTKRLDWLEMEVDREMRGVQKAQSLFRRRNSPITREIIDAAMAADGQGEGE